jgi:ferredoxin
MVIACAACHVELELGQNASVHTAGDIEVTTHHDSCAAVEHIEQCQAARR